MSADTGTWITVGWCLAPAVGIAAAYSARHGLFAREREGLLDVPLVGAVLAPAIVLALRYA